MLNLSSRLQAIYDHLVPGQPVWDFCCDHGLLGIKAYQSGNHPQIYFVDQVPHIMQRLENLFSRKALAGSSCQPHFFCQAGEAIDMDIHGTVVVAGVGSATIQMMLQSWLKCGNLKAFRLIFCPHKDAENFQKEVQSLQSFDSQYQLQEVLQILERGRARKVLIFQRVL